MAALARRMTASWPLLQRQVLTCTCSSLPCFSSSASSASSSSKAAPREAMEFDVVVVGAGPAGLAAAIRLRQLAKQRGRDVSVAVVEKAAAAGNHILSGNVLETRALDELLPDWKSRGAPIRVPVKSDAFYFLTQSRAVRLPTPPQMRNHGNYVISLSEVVAWLARHAEEEGVDIFPGFGATEVLYGDKGEVVGIATGDVGVGRGGEQKPTYTRGVELRARATLLAEGTRGSLTEDIIKNFHLRSIADHQTYALGIKEVWEVPAHVHDEGRVVHTVGWPLDYGTYGGSWLYHWDRSRVSLGYVVALDYRNPYLSPFEEFQRWKTHPYIRQVLEGGTCLQYGARTLNEGGMQSVPKLVFPGGALIGCSAGFLNVPKIKGTHLAMKTGMLAAEAAYEALSSLEESQDVVSLHNYEESVRSSWVWEELRSVRNVRPGFKHGLWAGLANAAIDTYLFRGNAPWTLKHAVPDHLATEPADKHTPIVYPKPDNKITFDVPTSLYRSGTNHDHDQPPHLKLRDPTVPSRVNYPVFAAPEMRYCPAKVYEYEVRVDAEEGKEHVKLVINAQNCLHCKACDIKDPTQNIKWVPPEGGGGPAYTIT